eukprot:gene4268-4520_t
MLFQLLAGSTLSPARTAATYAGIMACFSRHTGGHINPAISLAAALSGHLSWSTAATYIVAQVLGALAGGVVQVWITPGLAFGQTFLPSCHAPSIEGLGGTGLFLWETLAIFVFVYVLYPTLFAKAERSLLCPLIAAVTLYGVLSTGAGLAALLAVGVFGKGPMYMTAAERADYMALSGGEGSEELCYGHGLARGVVASAPGGSTIGAA